jgi:hypothetical protein
MAAVGYDPTKTARIGVYVPVELREQIDAWRSKQRPIPSESAAVVTLLRIVLAEIEREGDPKPERKRSVPSDDEGEFEFKIGCGRGHKECAFLRWGRCSGPRWSADLFIVRDARARGVE